MSKANSEQSRGLLERIRGLADRPLTFMEVCGTHTMSAARSGLRSLLPEGMRLISGPGCPVCVTPVSYVDHALALAGERGLTVATFGDMMRVPGSPIDGRPRSLAAVRAGGADVRVVYSPLDALELARSEPRREVVFLGVGFETTAPALAASLLRAGDEGLRNFSMLVAAKTIPGALELLATADDLEVDGVLCPGHVSVILGSEVYRPLAERHGVPCAVAGFEPVEMLRGIASLTEQAQRGEPRVDNCYPGAVRPEGNPRAREIAARALEPCDSVWRGLGTIPQSGLALREELADRDAARRFEVSLPEPVEPPGCRCGDVLKGRIAPIECPLFDRGCTPETPVGACMVSSEGSCAAAYAFSAGGSS
ncbi:MAG: hydrogenase formation protein HypD [Polyangia bacterium]